MVFPASGDPDAPPVNPLPLAVVLLALPIVLIEIIFVAGASGVVGGPEAIGWRLEWVQNQGLSGALFRYAVETGLWTYDFLHRFVSYPFVHSGFMHMVMVLVFLLAMGKLVGDTMGSAAVFIIFFGSAILGGFVYALLVPSQNALIGGYPAVYGLIGAYTYILWANLAATGGPTHQAFTLIAFLMGIQLVFGVLFGGNLDWIAELAGFCAGFGLSFLVRPGGMARIVERMRSR
ncbi:MAG: rhomboid family intramembrane serine protease [Pseudomonadota bacterium]